MGEAIESVKKKWKEASKDSPFDYFFMDEKFQSLYKSGIAIKESG